VARTGRVTLLSRDLETGASRATPKQIGAERPDLYEHFGHLHMAISGSLSA
jgi:hypothetical protein